MAKHKNAKEIWQDSDGWWAILKDGLVIDDCVGVREDTRAKLLQRLNDAKKGEPK